MLGFSEKTDPSSARASSRLRPSASLPRSSAMRSRASVTGFAIRPVRSASNASRYRASERRRAASAPPRA